MLDPQDFTLALDSSVKKITLAVIQGQKILSSFNDFPEESQSKSMIKILDDVLKKSGLQISDVKNLLYCHGPGSFTSLRVGLSTLMGLFYGREVNFAEVSSLLFRCLSVNSKNHVVISAVALGRQRFAVGTLIRDGHIFSEELLSEAEIMEKVTKTKGHLQAEDLTEPQAFLQVISKKLYNINSLNDCRIKYMMKPDIITSKS